MRHKHLVRAGVEGAHVASDGRPFGGALHAALESGANVEHEHPEARERIEQGAAVIVLEAPETQTQSRSSVKAEKAPGGLQRAKKRR